MMKDNDLLHFSLLSFPFLSHLYHPISLSLYILFRPNVFAWLLPLHWKPLLKHPQQKIAEIRAHGCESLAEGQQRGRSDGLQLWAAFHPPRGYHVRLAHMVAESSQLSFGTAEAAFLVLNLRVPLYAPHCLRSWWS